MPKTLAPLSVAEATIFGVWISVKPRSSRVARNPSAAAAAAVTAAGVAVACRRATDAWSSWVGRVAVSVGR